MIKSEKKLKELDAVLRKDNPLKVTEAIRLLREDEPFEGAIGLLIPCFDRSANLSVKLLIRDFMNDIKDLALRGEVISEIRKNYSPETLRMLISSCWQSGLDYGDYANDFAEIFILKDYMTAIECFTVIESSLAQLTRPAKDSLIKILSEGSLTINSDKSALVRELILMLR
ncbi:MAG: hypothetical protein WCE64_06405 [Bacteroidales bacterium]